MMNPGPVEEAGQTARSMIDSLKGTPMVLALVIFNVFYMAGTFWAIHEQNDRWHALVQTAFQACPSVPIK